MSEIIGVLAGEAGLLGACSVYSDTLLAANAHPGDVLWLYALSQAFAVGLATFAMFRYGLLVTAVMLVVDNIPSAVPIAPSAASWVAMPGNLSMALVITLACFGFYAARAGQPLFGKLELKT